MRTISMEEMLNRLKMCEELVKDIDPLLKPIAFELSFYSLFGNVTESDSTVNLESNFQIIEKNQMSLSELIKRAKAKNHTDKILLTAYNLFYDKEMDEFNANHIKSALQDARQPLPGNTNSILNGLINRGLLMKSTYDIDGQKGFRITQTGIDEINRMLEKNRE